VQFLEGVFHRANFNRRISQAQSNPKNPIEKTRSTATLSILNSKDNSRLKNSYHQVESNVSSSLSNFLSSPIPSMTPTLTVIPSSSSSRYPTYSTVWWNTTQRGTEIMEVLQNVSNPLLFLKESSQQEASSWIINKDPLNLSSDNEHLTQRYTLMILFFSSYDLEDFSEEYWNRHECEWDFLNCTDDNFIMRLWLGGNNLTGTIQTELGQLTHLEVLELYYNNLTGTIPTELGQLANLKYLELYYNSLSGTIPSELGKLSHLERLYLNDNNLTGTIPTELASLSNLKYLDLDDNRLTGIVPNKLFDITDRN